MAKKHHKGHKHTGPIHHKDMTSHFHGGMGKDPHASKEHHAANAANDMHDGIHPDDDAGQDGHWGGGGGEGMAGNAEVC